MDCWHGWHCCLHGALQVQGQPHHACEAAAQDEEADWEQDRRRQHGRGGLADLKSHLRRAAEKAGSGPEEREGPQSQPGLGERPRD